MKNIIIAAVIALLFTQNKVWTQVQSFPPNSSIKASDVNYNFSEIKKILDAKNRSVNFKIFQSGEVISRIEMDAEFQKIRSNDIFITPLSEDRLKSSDFNLAFTQAFSGVTAIPNWPLGLNGDLIISAGEVFTVNAGSVLDYETLEIKAGGVLRIIGPSSGDITIIGARKNMIINGTIESTDGVYESGVWTKTTPLGETISYSAALNLGGMGGSASGCYSSPGSAGGGSGRCGGGGSGGGRYGGGSGGSRACGAGSAGAAANITLGIGGNASGTSAGAGGGAGGGNGSGSGGGYPAGGAGGGGGYFGKHGKSLYLNCLCDITGSGNINLAGQNGFKGGNGSNGATGGGGGGGGAGGHGGNLWVRAKSNSVQYNILGGSGGSGGSGGLRTDSRCGNGTAGSSGSSGQSGVYDFIGI